VRLLPLVFLFAACPATDPTAGLDTTPTAALLDYNTFVCDAMPTLIRRCSYMACHGNEDHAFRVYSPGKLRIGDPATRAARDAALTADEIDKNYQSAVGLTRGTTMSQRGNVDLQNMPLLRKPLASRFGGDEHRGVAVFPVYPAVVPDADPEWQKLVNWTTGGKQTNPPTADCQAFFTSLGVSPK
jgi:hypothetical protein